MGGGFSFLSALEVNFFSYAILYFKNNALCTSGEVPTVIGHLSGEGMFSRNPTICATAHPLIVSKLELSAVLFWNIYHFCNFMTEVSSTKNGTNNMGLTTVFCCI